MFSVESLKTRGSWAMTKTAQAYRVWHDPCPVWDDDEASALGFLQRAQLLDALQFTVHM